MKIKSYIALPTLLTSLNIFFGFWAIIQAFGQHFATAAFLIFFAGIFDALDGRVARLFGTTSQFGLQMDSLGDVVSAGVAPAILVYFVYLHRLGFFGLIVSFLPLVFSAVRLARFNIFEGVRTRDNYFIGLPAPMASLTFGSVVLLYEGTGYRPLLQLLPLEVPLVSLLMISNFRYDGFPRFSLTEKRRGNRIKLAILATVLLLLPILPYYMLFVGIMIYLPSGPIRSLFGVKTPFDVISEAKKETFPDTPGP